MHISDVLSKNKYKFWTKFGVRWGTLFNDEKVQLCRWI